jgi:hypothetical protein
MVVSSALTEARARIVIDTGPMDEARVRIESNARAIGSALKRHVGDATEEAANRAWRSLEQFGTTLRDVGMGIGVVFGAISAGGVQAARSMAAVETSFRVMLGSQERVTAQMDAIRAMASRFHQPFTQMLQGAASFLPVIRGTNAELEHTLAVSLQLLAAAPGRTFEDAAFSIREFLTGDYISLSDRFNLSKAQLRAIRDEANGDVAAMIDGLGRYLAQLGYTEDALVQIGASGQNAFAILGDEVRQVGAVAFGPANRFLTQLASGVSDFLRTLREANPQLLEVAGGFAFVVASGGAFLTFLGQAINLVARLNSSLRAVGLAGGIGSLARMVGSIAAVGAGVAVGQVVGQQIAPENAAFQGSVGDVAARAITTLFAGLAMAVGRAGEALTELHFIFRSIGLQIQDAFGRALEAIGGFVLGIASLLSRLGIDATGTMQTGLEVLTRGSEARTAARTAAAGLIGERAEALAGAQAQTEALTASVTEFFIGLFGGAEAVARFRGEVEQVAETAVEATDEIGQAIADVEDFTDQQVNAWRTYQDDLQAITEQAEAEIVAARQEAEQRRQQLEANWRLQDRRSAEDEEIQARRRAAERAEQMVALTEQRDAKIADLQMQANERVLQEAAEHAERMEELERSHREALSDAVSRLDAVALWRELRSYQDRKQQEEENYSEQREQRRLQLEEQIAAEREAHERRMVEMQEQFAQEDALRAEDAALRAQRLAEDRQMELAALEAQLNDRLTAIENQASAERRARELAFIEEFNQLSTHQGQMINLQREGQDVAEAELRAWWTRMARIFGTTPVVEEAPLTRRTSAGTGGRLGGYQRYPEFAIGGTVQETGLIYAHAGEEILNPGLAAIFRMLFGSGTLPPAAFASAFAGGPTYNSRAVTWNGDLNYGGPAGDNLGDIGAAIRQALMDILTELGS